MGVVTARFLFLAFLGLTATITYNALYLQEHAPHGMADAGVDTPVGYATTKVIGVDKAATNSGAASTYSKGRSAVATTDLPAPAGALAQSPQVVKAIQRELSMRGYDVGAVDGQLTDKTRNAIAAFEMQQGLPVTGVPSDDVLRQILLGDTIAPSEATGSVPIGQDASAAKKVPAAKKIAKAVAEDSQILRVQRVLAELGYAPGALDGAWGENTARAVKAFQRDRNMAETGTITPALLIELKRVTGRDLT